MDKTADTTKSSANERKIWVKPEVVDVDGSAGAIESGVGAVVDGFSSSTS